MFPWVPNGLPTISGQDLDKLSEMWGVLRSPGETDDQLRRRTREYAQSFGSDLELPLGSPKTPACECGAHKLGYTQQGPGHSTWCDLFSK